MNNIEILTNSYLSELRALTRKLNAQEIKDVISLIRSIIDSESTIFTCGNGGSAYAASHYITDWNKMLSVYTDKKLKGISLCDNIGIITAFGNDQSYDDIFIGQLKSLAKPGDILLCVSGSGNSKNLIKAVDFANKNQIHTIGFLGYDGGALKNKCQIKVCIPSFDMQLCEDVHLMLGHIIMKALCDKGVVTDD